MIAPRMPVETTRMAVNDGGPPSFSVMPVATGAQADFGASASSVSRKASSSQAMPAVNACSMRATML
jgi:hypothetical protein